MTLADVVQEAQEPVNETYHDAARGRLEARLSKLRYQVRGQLLGQGLLDEDVSYEMYLNMRYQGTETSIMVLHPENGDFKTEFQKSHLREFSFVFPDTRPIYVDDVRVRGIGTNGRNGVDDKQLDDQLRNTAFKPAPPNLAELVVSHGWCSPAEYWFAHSGRPPFISRMPGTGPRQSSGFRICHPISKFKGQLLLSTRHRH